MKADSDLSPGPQTWSIKLSAPGTESRRWAWPCRFISSSFWKWHSPVTFDLVRQEAVECPGDHGMTITRSKVKQLLVVLRQSGLTGYVLWPTY
jgi:hypothetical protein